MKASKQRKMSRAIVSNKALKGIDAQRLTDMQNKVIKNRYKHDRKVWRDIRNSINKAANVT